MTMKIVTYSLASGIKGTEKLEKPVLRICEVYIINGHVRDTDEFVITGTKKIYRAWYDFLRSEGKYTMTDRADGFFRKTVRATKTYQWGR